MIDLINLQQNWLNNIMSNQFKPMVAKMMHYIILASRKEIINNNNIIPSGNQVINQMTPNKSSTTSNHNPQPLPSNSNRNPPAPLLHSRIGPRKRFSTGKRFAINQRHRFRERGGRRGIGRRKRGEIRLNYKEGGANENAEENEEETLLFEEIIEGSREGSVMF
ncbi:hypothetical protein AgCh_013273 [Apium graveolens]